MQKLRNDRSELKKCYLFVSPTGRYQTLETMQELQRSVGNGFVMSIDVNAPIDAAGSYYTMFSNKVYKVTAAPEQITIASFNTEIADFFLDSERCIVYILVADGKVMRFQNGIGTLVRGGIT